MQQKKVVLQGQGEPQEWKDFMRSSNHASWNSYELKFLNDKTIQFLGR